MMWSDFSLDSFLFCPTGKCLKLAPKIYIYSVYLTRIRGVPKKWTGLQACNFRSRAIIKKRLRSAETRKLGISDLNLYYMFTREKVSVNARLYIAAFSHILETSISFIDLGIRYLTSARYSQYLLSTARLAPIKKPHGLQQSASVVDRKGIQDLGLFHFIPEEFGINFATYTSC